MILSAFKTTPKLAWFSLLALTIFLEIEPLPHEIYPPLFYFYKCLKGLLFLALGFLTPLAFWRFNSLGRGVIAAAASACAVELFQGFFQGHRFSWFELSLKLMVIFIGFAFALNARYDERISLGTWKIRLTSEHFRH
jgi:glycopeptide antibiotics resistance protein